MSRRDKDDSDRNSSKRKRDDSQSKIAQSLGYSDSSNPFGDNKLSDKFVWKLKEKEKGKEKQVDDDEETEEQRSNRLYEELQKAKQRRLEREKQKALEREETDRMNRMNQGEAAINWEKEEEAFELKQHKLRSEIRIKEGRPQMIDLFYMTSYPEQFQNQKLTLQTALIPPPKLIQSISDIQGLNTLQNEIEQFRKLDPKSDFWKLASNFVDFEKQRNAQKSGASNTGIHPNVLKDIESIITNKTLPELQSLDTAVAKKLEERDNIDVEYWETLKNRIESEQCRLKLMQYHDKASSVLNTGSSSNSLTVSAQENNNNTKAKELIPGVSPALQQTVSKLSSSLHRKLTEEEMFRQESERSVDDEEENFDEKHPLPNVTYQWADKYRPRKPRYYNRVKVGYDWNQYNRAHFDSENPPPKKVQGYRFNIFYPDLMTNETPQYFVEPHPTEPEYTIIRFHAGAPYEDIAFKMVKADWEHSSRKGFKCVFERGILHLWFNFKKFKWRR